jgi:signal peptidase I
VKTSEEFSQDDAPSQQGHPQKKKKSHAREYTEALLTAVLIALFLRSFVVEAFKIPSGSMIPTLVVGDHIFVNKFTYGLRVPFTHRWLVRFRSPERGETVVFIYPEDPKLDFIKRVVGVPGDNIRIDGDELYVNGELVRTAPAKVAGVDPENSQRLDLDPVGDFPESGDFKTVAKTPHWQEYQVFLERLGEHTHLKQEGSFNWMKVRDIVVPEGSLFVMGDNRDNSKDSREWGFVPIDNVKGKAMFIWLSLRREDCDSFMCFRWDRFGQSIP